MRMYMRVSPRLGVPAFAGAGSRVWMSMRVRACTGAYRHV